MKARGLTLKRLGPDVVGLSLATATGPVFAMLDPPGVADAHGDTMPADALTLPPGVSEIPLYWLHSYHDGLIPDASPEQRLPVGVATVWREGGQWYFTPTFNGLTDLSKQAEAALAAGQVVACSIGYLTVRGTPNGKGPDGQGEDVHEARLLEVSLIPPGEQGAKSGAVRVKAMPDDPQKNEQQPEAPDFKALLSKFDALAAKVEAMHGKMFPPEEEPAEEAPPAETKSEPAPSDPPPPTEDVATKFWRRFSQPAV